MKKLLSFSIMLILAATFSIGCKQDSVSTGGLTQSAPVKKIQSPTPTAGNTAKSVAGNHKAAKAQEVDHYTAHLIDVLDPSNDASFPNQIRICSRLQPVVLNGDLDITVDPSGEWHMTISNFKAMDFGQWQSSWDPSWSPNDAFNFTISQNGINQGYLWIGSGSWLENGGHYEGSQKEPVTITLTDVATWANPVPFDISVRFSRNESGEFSSQVVSSTCQ